MKGKTNKQLPHDVMAMLDKLFLSRVLGLSDATRVHEPLKGNTFQTTIKHVMNMYNEKALLAPVARVPEKQHCGTVITGQPSSFHHRHMVDT